ncbi:hypothetical protein [Spongiactinospora sp. TRM90649]|uniref:hypothetical protein n=1 Tax=Spongiactinospora sp. TRM90649 TaxID=3031114 RepID=UPI0023F7DFC8|nr:hypothetical protein [Spongiactinospora sp. TRM90649]MDF5757314.1 hypothetical protein [Spongiactinospora sp. TRM90649]
MANMDQERRFTAVQAAFIGLGSAGGMLEYLARGLGEGHLATVASWLLYATNAIVTAMVAVTFGSDHVREHRARPRPPLA